MTAIIPTVLHNRDLITNEQRMWEVFHRIHLAYMICTAIFGNGAAINGTVIITVHRVTEVLGKLEQIITVCFVVVRGATMRSIAAVPFVARIRRNSGGRTRVFALRWRRFLSCPSFPGEDSSFLSNPFAIFSLDTFVGCVAI